MSDAVQSVVYFVRIGKHIKIGVTNNLARRLKEFATTAFDLKVLVAIPGDRSLERRLHDLMQDSRLERELFRDDWRVIRFIEMYRYAGLEKAIQHLEESTPCALARRKEEARVERVVEARKSKAEKDAYFASLVADRKRRIGW